MAILENILKPLSYVKNNIPGQMQAGTWNILPAVLSTWSNLIQLHNQTSGDSYTLYKKQAKEYIDAARKNAQLLENQGAIALRNLQYKAKLERSNDVLRVAASNSNIGGTHLDVVVRKEKIRKMNEMALRANYTNQALMELNNGYQHAAQIYGTINQNAKTVKWGVLNSILKGFETHSALTKRDAELTNRLTVANKNIDTTFNLNMANLRYEYEGLSPIRSNPGEYYSLQEQLNQELNFNNDKSLFDTSNNSTYTDIQFST